MNRLIPAVSAVIWSLAAVSCTLPVQLDDHAKRTNQIAWQVQHEMILMNILRARDHEPMLFTSLNQVRGSMKYTASSGTIPLPFGGDATDLYGVNPTVSIESNPTFDISILDNEEFYRGILTPLKLQMLQLYESQGWPKDLLFLLALESYPGCDEDSWCGNDPENPKQLERFTEFLTEFVDCEAEPLCIEIDKGESKPMKIGAGALRQFDIVAALKAGYTIKQVSKDQYRITKPAGLVLYGPESMGETSRTVTFADDDVIYVIESPAGKVHLRSPHGIIYYLGESLRPKSGRLRLAPNADPEFDVQCGENKEADDFVLSVKHDNQLCGILREDSKSLRVLSFISQLLGLSKSAESLPTTGAVQVVN